MKATTTTQLWASYQELGSLRAVCKRHGLISVGSVCMRLRKAGYTLRPRGANGSGRRVSTEDLRAIKERAGSYAAAAEQIGSTPDAVRMRLARANRGAKA